MHFPYENIDHDVETTLICITTHLRVSFSTANYML